MNKFFKLFALTMMSMITAVTFQNCSGVDKLETFEGQVSSLGPGQIDNQPLPASEAPNGVPVVIAYSSPDAQADCSRDGATMHQSIKNAGVDVRICAEFVLSAKGRVGETNLCDNPNKFSAINPTDYVYDAGTKTWSLRAGDIKLKNHAFVVPGMYRVAILDDKGVLYKSNDVFVVKSQSANCSPSAVVAPAPVAKTCSWSAFVVGGTSPVKPADVCSLSSVGAKAQASGYSWTCVCQ